MSEKITVQLAEITGLLREIVMLLRLKDSSFSFTSAYELPEKVRVLCTFCGVEISEGATHMCVSTRDDNVTKTSNT